MSDKCKSCEDREAYKLFEYCALCANLMLTLVNTHDPVLHDDAEGYARRTYKKYKEPIVHPGIQHD